MPIFLYWFRCTIQFWNNLLSSNNPLLEKVVQADLVLANISNTWTYQVLDALRDVPDPQHLLDAVHSRQPINVKQFKLTLREHIIRNWRDLDNCTPYEAHHSSRIMRTHHTHFGVPLGNTPGWWDDRKRNHKPVLPLYLRMDIPSNLSRALVTYLHGSNSTSAHCWHQVRYFEQKTCYVVAFSGFRFDSWLLRMSCLGHFFSNLQFLKSYFCTRPSSWLSETSFGCQKKH